MSTTIDERVVEMKFKNSDFEKNAQQSLSTIAKIKQSLNFKDSAKGLDGISSAAKNITFSNMSSGLDTVRVKFSALEVMAIATLTRITNKITSTAESIAKSLTIEPVSTGFEEYELKMDSIQTIMASSGADLETVKDKLEDLNKYADDTIYSFSDMTTNIGKFTNAGVDLDMAVNAIKGISNEAAVSGANANEASRAMYNFAQALSAGYVKLIDWKSIELANMATVEFKDQLLETAVSAGTLQKAADGMYKVLSTDGNGSTMDGTISATQNFNDSLSYQWMTTEVLTTTLAKYADKTTEIGKKAYSAAQDLKTFTQMMDTLKEAAGSGWGTTWETIIGDYNQAKVVFTELGNTFSDIITKSADARNTLLAEALGNDFDSLRAKVEGTGISFDDFEKKAFKIAKKQGLFDSDIQTLDDLTRKYGSFKDSLSSGWLSNTVFAKTLRSLAGTTKQVTTSTEKATNSLNKLKKVADQVISGKYGNGADRIKALTKAGYDYASVQSIVNNKLLGTKISIKDLSDEELQNEGYTKKQIKALRELADQAEQSGSSISDLVNKLQKPTGRELLFDSLKNIINGIITATSTLKKAWRDIFPAITSEQLYNLISGFNKLTKRLAMSAKTAKKVRRTLRGFFAVIDIGVSTLNQIARFGFELLSSALGSVNIDVLKLTANVGDTIVSFRNWYKSHQLIYDGLHKITDAIKTSIEFVKKWIDAFLKLPEVQSKIESLQTSFGKFIGNFSGYISDFKNLVGEFIGRVQNLDGLTLDTIGAALIRFKDYVITTVVTTVQKFGSLGDIMDFFKDKFEDSLNSSSSSANKFVKKAGKVADFLQDKFSGFSFGGLISAFLGYKLAKTFKSYVATLTPFADLTKSVSGTFGSLTAMFKQFTKNLKVARLIQIATAIAVLTLSVKSLANIPADKLFKAVAALAALSAILVGLVYALDLIGDVKLSLNGTKSFLGIAAGLIVLIGALKLLDSMSLENLNRSLVIMAGLMVGIVAASMVLSKATGQLSFSALGLIAFAAAMLIMVRALNALGKLDVKGVKQNLSELSGIFVVLVGLTALSFMGAQLTGMGSILLGLGVALLASVKAIKMLSKMRATDIERGKNALIELIGILSIVVAVSAFTGEKAAQAGVMLLGLSVSLGILVGVISVLGHMDQTALQNGIRAVGEISAIFALLIVASYAAKDARPTLIVMVTAIAAIATALGVLSMINPDSLMTATKAMSIVLGMFAVLMYSTKKVSACKGTVIALGLMVTALGGILVALSMQDPNSVIKSALGLSIVLAALIASTSILTKVGGISKGAVTKTILMTALVAAVGGILIALANTPNPNAVLPIAKGIATILQQLTIAVGVLSVASNLSSAAGLLKTAGTMLVIVGVLAAILEAVGALLNKFDSNGYAVANLDTAIEFISKIFSGIGQILGSAISGIGVGLTSGLPQMATDLSDFATKIQPFINGVKNIEPDTAKSVYYLTSAMKELTSGSLLTFVKSKVTGTNDMGDWIENINSLGSALKDLASDNALTEKDVESIQNTSKAIKYVSRAAKQIPNEGGLAGMLAGNNDPAVFGNKMVSFARSLVRYGNVAKNLKQRHIDGIKMSADAASEISALATSIPNMGGFVSYIVGDNDMGTFGEQLCQFGSYLVRFAKNASILAEEPIDAETGKKMSSMIDRLKPVLDVLPQLFEVAESVPKTSGGLSGLVAGFSNIETFGEQVVSFGQNLSGFAGSAKDISDDDLLAIRRSAAGATALINAAKQIPGDKTDVNIYGLSSFASQLGTVGTSLIKYSSSISALTDDDVLRIRTSAGAIKSLLSVYSVLSETTLSEIPESTLLASFGGQLASFGAHMVEYANTVSGLTYSNILDIKMSASAAMAMVNVLQAIPDSSEAGIFSAGTLGSMGNQLVIFGNSLKNYSETVSGVDSEKLTESISWLTRFGNIKTVDFSGLIDKTTTALQTYTNTISSKFETVGEQLTLSLNKGITNKTNETKTAISKVCQAGVTKAKEYKDDFKTVGTQLANGLKNGFTDESTSINDAVTQVVENALTAANNAAGVESPSKYTYKTGMYLSLGLVKGLIKYSSSVSNAAEQVSDAAVQNMGNISARIAAAVKQEGVSPTITPVLDMSEVQNGMSLINGMWTKTTPTLGYSIADNINRSSDFKTVMDVTSRNDDVVTAISELREDVSTLREAMAEWKIVMDTGATVGALTGPMDKALGVRTLRKKRRGG